MQRLFFLLAIFSLFACNQSPTEPVERLNAAEYTIAAPVTYYIDPTHSSIAFSIPFWGITQVQGRFDKFIGTISLDGEDMANSHAEIFIETSSINTNNAKRDRDLIRKYLESDKHPFIHFVSTAISKEGDRYKLTGNLALHGTVQPITATFWFTGVIDEPDKRREAGIMMEAEMIDRTTYGITKGLMSEGREFVGKDVTPEISLRLLELTAEKKAYTDTASTLSLPAKNEVDTYTSEDQAVSYKIYYLENKILTSYHVRDRELLRELVPVSDNQFLFKYHPGEELTIEGDTLVFVRDGKRLGEAIKE